MATYIVICQVTLIYSVATEGSKYKATLAAAEQSCHATKNTALHKYIVVDVKKKTKKKQTL